MLAIVVAERGAIAHRPATSSRSRRAFKARYAASDQLVPCLGTVATQRQEPYTHRRVASGDLSIDRQNKIAARDFPPRSGQLASHAPERLSGMV